jgi:alanine-glyoxylate transaminase/serine-glyoxylate transaminase/serine-pyruvate transaminase
LLPDGHDADTFRRIALDNFDISFGASFGILSGTYFRIGHLGDTNDLTILSAVAAAEMTLTLHKVPHKPGGVQAAMEFLTDAKTNLN